MSFTSIALRCLACGGKLGSHFLWTGDGAYHHACFPSSPKEDELASLRAQVASLQKELAERTAERDDARAEIEHWQKGATCGCRYDSPDDVCDLHSPAVAAEKSRADTLARRVEEMEAALKHDQWAIVSRAVERFISGEIS